jgi:hypothetical protein
MGSSRTITLFSVQTDERQKISSVLVSMVVHVVTIVLVSIGVYESKIGTPIPTTRFEVRRLDLQIPKEALRSNANQVEYQAPSKAASAPTPGGNAKMHAPALQEMAKLDLGPQTLVQPDIHTPKPVIKPIPVPSVAIWQPVKVEVQKIVAPLPQQEVAMQTNPVLNPPNHALTVRDVEISPSDLSNEKLPIVASTTTPLALEGRNLPQPAPMTASKSSSLPTPATVVSLSNLSMLNGTVVLPPINETASSARRGIVNAGEGAGKNNTKEGIGKGEGGVRGAGSGPKAGEGTTSSSGGRGSHPGEGEGSGSVSGSGSLTMAQITLPKEGHFGAVVVGNTLGGEFPEIGDVWNSRIAYTVYLHVGLDKSWIMQYSLPRMADAHAGGQVAQLDAPWPYSIVRPNLTAGSINGDALMVHGYLNKLGHFEGLSIAFPPDFSEGKFVLNALQQWEFRPAKQNGLAAKVEILLIIPEEVYESQAVRPQARPSSSGFVRPAAQPAMGVYSASGHFHIFGSDQPGSKEDKADTAKRAR